MPNDNDYSARLASRIRAYREKHPVAYAEHEAHAYIKLAPPLRYRAGPLPGFVQLVLDQMTAESIRLQKGWPDEKTFLLQNA